MDMADRYVRFSVALLVLALSSLRRVVPRSVEPPVDDDDDDGGVHLHGTQRGHRLSVVDRGDSHPLE
jgi:hypothetical protein